MAGSTNGGPSRAWNEPGSGGRICTKRTNRRAKKTLMGPIAIKVENFWDKPMIMWKTYWVLAQRNVFGFWGFVELTKLRNFYRHSAQNGI